MTVLEQFEIELSASISEVTMSEIMAHLGFIQLNNNQDLEQV